MIKKKDLFEYGYQIILIIGMMFLGPLATSQIADLAFPEPIKKEIVQVEEGEKEYKEQQNRYYEMLASTQQKQFYIKAITGLGFLLIGALYSVHTIAGGFILSGIITLTLTFTDNWAQTTKLLRLISLLVAIAILTFASKRTWHD